MNSYTSEERDSAKVFEGRSSVELKKTSKGYSWNVKCYDDISDEDVANIKKRVEELDLWLSNTFGGGED